jgi:hypothetical protein
MKTRMFFAVSNSLALSLIFSFAALAATFLLLGGQTAQAQGVNPDFCLDPANLLQNCGFSSGTSPWQTFLESGDVTWTWGYNDPECHAIDRPCIGAYSDRAFVAGIYQQVSGLTPGTTYQANVTLLWLDSYNKTQWVMGRKIGIDPTGGTDPRSPNIVWSEEIWGTEDEAISVTQAKLHTAAVAQGDTVTVFLRIDAPREFYGQTWPGVDHVWIDDVGMVAMPAVQFSSRSFSVDEGAGAATINVILSSPSDQTVTVDYATGDGTATAGSDYLAVSGTLAFTPGQTGKSFEVPILSDVETELVETVTLTISNASNALIVAASANATLAIADPITYFTYLPFIARQPEADVCQPIPGESYGAMSPLSAPTDRPAEEHADLNLALRGYELTDAYKGLVYYNGSGGDPNAPQLSGLFADNRLPAFSTAYRVHGWDWGCNCRGPLLTSWDVTLAGLAVAPGEIIHVPGSGYEIGSGYEALVLYASPERITLKYTPDDNVVEGYTIHVENVCVEPNLLALYQSLNDAGRARLPALRAGQAFGRARGGEIGVAIRDRGSFMDPRSRGDWWHGW